MNLSTILRHSFIVSALLTQEVHAQIQTIPLPLQEISAPSAANLSSTLAVLVSPSSTSPTIITTDSTTEIPDQIPHSLETALQREIRKHDPWVLEFIESDYIHSPTRPVTLAKHDPLFERFMKNMGMLLGSGSYIPTENMLAFPIVLELSEVADSVDHELLHVLFDRYNKGLRQDPWYHGPSKAYIAIWCQEQLERVDYQRLRGKLEKTIEQMDILGRIETITQTIQKEQAVLPQIQSLAREMTGEYPQLKKYMMPREFEYVRRALGEVSHSVIKQKESIQESVLVLQGTITESELNPLPELNAPSELNIPSGPKSQPRFQSHSLFDKPVYTPIIPTLIKKLAKAQEIIDCAYGRMSGNLTMPRSHLRIQNSLRQLDDAQRRTDIINANKKRMREMLDDPGEFMARILDSVYSIYLGPMTPNKFPIDLQMLEFLRGFYWQGRPMFEKGLSKGYLSLQMQADGVPIRKITQELEYATNYTYKNMHYRFPQTKFTILGKVPTWNWRNVVPDIDLLEKEEIEGE